MKQIRYLFGGLLFLFASTGSVTAQEVSDYSKLQPSDYSSITPVSYTHLTLPTT